MANNDFAKALIKDYEELALGVAKGELTIQSHDGDTVVEFESVQDEQNENSGLAVYANGTAVETLSYDDEEFSSKLNNLMFGLLDA